MGRPEEYDEPTKGFFEDLRGFVLWGAVVVAVCVAAAAALMMVFPSWEQRSAFGEMFGSVNALFAGLAFAGLIYTIALQRNELRLQREELSLTRGELERAAEAQEKSVTALSQQVEVSQQQVQAVYRPYITVKPELVRNSLQLVIENTGQTPANDLDLELSQYVAPISFANERGKEETLNALHAFQNPLKTFPPGATLTFKLADLYFFTHGDEEGRPSIPPFDVTARYEYSGSQQEAVETTTVDVEPYLDSSTSSGDSTSAHLEQIAKTLGKMEDDMDTKKLRKEIEGIADQVQEVKKSNGADVLDKPIGKIADQLKKTHRMLKKKLK